MSIKADQNNQIELCLGVLRFIACRGLYRDKQSRKIFCDIEWKSRCIVTGNLSLFSLIFDVWLSFVSSVFSMFLNHVISFKFCPIYNIPSILSLF